MLQFVPSKIMKIKTSRILRNVEIKTDIEGLHQHMHMQTGHIKNCSHLSTWEMCCFFF